MKKVLGIDLGGTSAKVGIVNQYGEIERKTIIENDFNNLLENLSIKIKQQLIEWGYDYNIDIEKIGFASPGFINHEIGEVVISGNLGWKDFPLKEELKKYFGGKEINVLNDANAAALGEFWTGSASTFNSEIFYTLGTGVGGAIIMEGKLISGENGFAGEFGHGGIMQNVFPCNCGLKNCLEPTSSAIGIAKAFSNYIEKENYLWIKNKYFPKVQKIDLKLIAETYAKYNHPQEIKNLLLDIMKPLLSHMSIMITALNPKAIIIGGGGANMGQDLIDLIEEGLDPLILNIYKGQLRIETAKLGNDAGIVGAAYYAINNWVY